MRLRKVTIDSVAFALTLGACANRPLDLPSSTPFPPDDLAALDDLAAPDDLSLAFDLEPAADLSIRAISVSPPRPVAPLSGSHVTSRRPTLRWQLAADSDGAEVELCRDRACTQPFASFVADGDHLRPSSDLPAGVVFWRLTGRRAGAIGATLGPTWQFTVGARSAPLDLAYGSTLDVDGDGFADLLTWSYDSSRNDTGVVSLRRGGPSGLPATASQMLYPAEPNFEFGMSGLFDAGDVNGDGFVDVLVSTTVLGYQPDAGNILSGRVDLFYGGAGGLTPSPAFTLDGQDGIDGLFGGGSNDAIAGAGDINGDGYADVVVGAPGADQSAGRAYVFFGGPNGLVDTPDQQLQPTPSPSPGQGFGIQIVALGDINGDGFADVAVFDWGDGDPFIYLGGASGLVPSGRISSGMVSVFGFAGAHDFNGDGYADLVLSEAFDGSEAGEAALFLGGPDGFQATPDRAFASIDGDYSLFGNGVGSPGDLDGDGYDDLVFTDVLLDDADDGSARAFVYRGGPGGLSAQPAATLTLPPTLMRTTWVAASKDIDGDGFADVILGQFNQPAIDLRGCIYLYRGGPNGVVDGNPQVICGQSEDEFAVLFN